MDFVYRTRKFLCRAILAGLLPLAAVAAAGAAAAPAAPAAVFKFKRIVLADSLKALGEIHPAPDAGPIVVQGVPLLQTADFRRHLAPYLGRPITTQTVNDLAKDVDAYVRQHDRLVVNVLMPNQDISGGEFRLAVVIGRYSELKFRGNRWFSDKLLESKLGVKPGDEVRLSVLESAVNWANANPFRHVDVVINTINKQPGIADLDIAVMEHIPVRVALSYDDAGNEVLGNNHYSASLQFGNLWGRDHQATYQFSTAGEPRTYQAHNFDYRLPLPWHHFLVLDAAYALVRPSLEDGLIKINARSEVADLHYNIPFTRGQWRFESSTGIDFKRSNSNLIYGGQVIDLYNSNVDVIQFNENFSGVFPDRRGATAFALNLNFSPGGIDKLNTDAAFAAAKAGSTFWPSRYLYGTLVIQRRLDLPAGFQAFTKVIGQVSSTNLLSSEELSLGGSTTVRGYNELLYTGDQGVILSEELQAPVERVRLPFLPKKSTPLQLRPLAFLDYGRVYYKHLFNGYNLLPPLMSAGLGLRASLATNLNLSFDYGWQILRTSPPQPNHGRGHIRLTLAY